MMPAVAEERRAPRIVGVEFPFGHAFGVPNDKAMQRRVLELALRVLAGASSSGARVDFDQECRCRFARPTRRGSRKSQARSSGSFWSREPRVAPSLLPGAVLLQQLAQ